MGTYVPPAATLISVVLAPGYNVPAKDGIIVVLAGGSQPSTSVNAYASVLSVFGRASRRARPVDLHWTKLGNRDGEQHLRWSRPLAVSRLSVTEWMPVKRSDHAAGGAWGISHAAQNEFAGALLRVFAADQCDVVKWLRARPGRVASIYAPWVKVFMRYQGEIASYRRAMIPARVYRPPPADAYIPPASDDITVALPSGYSPPPMMSVNVAMIDLTQMPPVVVQRADPARWVIRWGLVATADNRYVIRWGLGPQPHRPDPPPIDNPWTGSPNEPPPIPIARRVY